MRPHDPKGGPRPRRLRPGLEALEARALLSSHPLGPPFPGHHYPATGVKLFIRLLFPPETSQPTPSEVRRVSFVAKAVGTYTVGPGRFADQALAIKGGGKTASSNASFISRFQFILFEPKDPAQPLTGVIHYLPANSLQSGGGIILDLSRPTGTEINGLPTHLNRTHDGASGVPFVGARTLPSFNGTAPIPGTNKITPSTIVDFNRGAGGTTLKSIPDPHPIPVTEGSGQVIIVSRGILDAPPDNPIDKNDG